MSLRNYRAFTMTEALAAVRSDLGADAVIIHTRTFTQGGFLGIGKRSVIEVTASRADEVAAKQTRAPKSIAQPVAQPVVSRAYRAASSVVAADPPARASDEVLPDRHRTRLLAQAMAVTLERDRREAQRTSASAAASANESATAQANAVAQANATARGQQAVTVPVPPAPVAQRYVLVPESRSSGRAARTTAQHAETPRSAPRGTGDVGAARPASPPMREDPVDLDAIDRLVGDVLRRSGAAAEEPPPGRLAGLYATLVAQEVGRDLATRIVDELRGSLTPEELASDHAVRSAAVERVAKLLPASGGFAPDGEHPGGWRRDGRPFTVAFVGPTGVGKTTTVAKIAAVLKLRHGARVGLVTCDTYRIAAVDQLRTYAEIIGVPLEVVLSPGQMRLAVQKLRELDVVLIDTAGRSQNDSERLGELKAIVAAAEPHETHLVLSSVASERVLQREAQAFSSVGVDKVVLTKLDEAAGLGAVMRVLRDVGRSVSYITTGQEVPQHIEPARSTRLAEFMLAGMTAGAGGSAT